MATVIAIAMAAAMLAAGEPPFAPAAWSPDGRRIAFVVAAGDEATLLPPDWLFPGTKAAAPPTGARRAQLWVGVPDTADCRLVLETAGRFSPPCWSADGGSLFVARFEADPDAKPAGGRLAGKLALLRRWRDGRLATLHEEPAALRAEEIDGFTASPPAAADDGLHVATPWPAAEGLLVHSLDLARPVARLKGARFPAWAPGGRRLAAFRVLDTAGIDVVAVGRWDAPQRLLDVRQQAQPVLWDRNGEAFLAVRFGGENRLPPPRLDIVRVHARDGRVAVLCQVPLNERPAEAASCWFSYDPRNESLVFTLFRADAPAHLDRWDLDAPSSRESFWHPLDELEIHPQAQLPLGALTADPTRRRLAFRYGLPEWGAPVGVWEPTAQRFASWAPNDATRLRALGALAAAARRLLDPPAPGAPSPFAPEPVGGADERRKVRAGAGDLTKCFPQPGSRDAQKARELAGLRRIAVHGGDLVRAARADTAPRAPDVARRLDELDLFFASCRQDHAAALRALDRLGGHDGPVGRDERFVRQVLRAQAQLGAGRPALARLALADFAERRDDEGPSPAVRRAWASRIERLAATALRAIPEAER